MAFLCAGGADGVFAGMEFYAEDQPWLVPTTVVHVDERECVADFTYSFLSGEEIDMPRVGSWFSTLGPFCCLDGGEFDLRKFESRERDALKSGGESDVNGDESAAALQSTLEAPEP